MPAVDSNNTVSVITATTEQHSTTLTRGDLVSIRSPSLVRRHVNFNACSESEQQQVALIAAELGA